MCLKSSADTWPTVNAMRAIVSPNELYAHAIAIAREMAAEEAGHVEVLEDLLERTALPGPQSRVLFER